MAGTMRPAFSTITINKRSLTIRGPIDFGEDEKAEAYFWVRVTNGGGAEAFGDDEMDETHTKKAAQVADKALKDMLEQPRGAGAAGPLATPAQIRTVSPMWKATIPIKEGTFTYGENVAIEAWALVRTKEPERMFHIYWEDKNFEIPAR